MILSKTMRKYMCVFAVSCGFFPAMARATPTNVPPKIRAFFSTYCSRCHGAKTQKADFRVETMLKVSRTPTDAEYWQLVLGNLNLGEMLPKDEKQPSAKEHDAVTEWIGAELRRARRVLSGEADEVVSRYTWAWD